MIIFPINDKKYQAILPEVAAIFIYRFLVDRWVYILSNLNMVSAFINIVFSTGRSIYFAWHKHCIDVK